MKPTLSELLPHRSPMIFLTAIESVDMVKGTLTARVDVTSRDMMFDPDLGGVPIFATVEYMAQAVGCFVGYTDLSQNPPRTPGVGFVLGSRKLSFAQNVLKPGESYFVRVNLLFFDENIASFDCLVYNAANETVASGILNAYRPDDIKEFMKEYK